MCIKQSVWGIEAPYSTRLCLVLYGPLDPAPVLYYSYSTPVHALTITYTVTDTHTQEGYDKAIAALDEKIENSTEVEETLSLLTQRSKMQEEKSKMQEE